MGIVATSRLPMTRCPSKEGNCLPLFVVPWSEGRNWRVILPLLFPPRRRNGLTLYGRQVRGWSNARLARCGMARSVESQPPKGHAPSPPVTTCLALCTTYPLAVLFSAIVDTLNSLSGGRWGSLGGRDQSCLPSFPVRSRKRTRPSWQPRPPLQGSAFRQHRRTVDG